MEVLKETYPFKIGHFECLVIHDATFITPDKDPEETMEVHCLFIRTGKNNILIDTGWGVGVGPQDGKLVHNLQRAGITCSEIDMVIPTHAHPDHIGGNADARGRAVFPNARYIFNRKEWEFWVSDPDLSRVKETIRQEILQSIQKSLLPVQDRIELFDGETEIVPGIELIEAPGHTPAHIVLVVSSGAEQLLCVGDLFRETSMVERPYLPMDFDQEPEQAVHTRIQILSRFKKTNPLVFGGHFPFPGLGHIIPKGDAWLWQPLH